MSQAQMDEQIERALAEWGNHPMMSAEEVRHFLELRLRETLDEEVWEQVKLEIGL